MDNQSGVHAQSTACPVMTVAVSDRAFSFLARHCGRTAFGSLGATATRLTWDGLKLRSKGRACQCQFTQGVRPSTIVGPVPNRPRCEQFTLKHSMTSMVGFGACQHVNTDKPIGHRSRSVPTHICYSLCWRWHRSLCQGNTKFAWRQHSSAPASSLACPRARELYIDRAMYRGKRYTQAHGK